MNKRGQFYLIGALIIIIVVISLLAVNNYARTKPSDSNVYDISNDISRESKDVIDYGVYNTGTGDINALMSNFTNSYVKSEPAKKWFFVFGNVNNVTIIAYKVSDSVINIDVGGSDTRTTITSSTKPFQTNIEPTGLERHVNITIDAAKYRFDLKPGQNFYFIISEKTSSGEDIISHGQ